MRRFTKLLPLLLLAGTTMANDIKAPSIYQEKEKKTRNAHYEGGFLSHLNIAAGVSTLGFTVEAATPITSNLKLRAGIDFMSYSADTFDIDLEDPQGALREAFGYIPNFEMSPSLSAFHGHLLVDYYPFKKGIFHLTAGLYLGSTKLKAEGLLTDYNGNPAQLKPGYDWPTIEFDGNEIKTDNARIDAELTLGQVIKPYVGLGLGRAVSKRRIGVKFDLGVLYQGDYTLKQNGRTVATTSNAEASIDGAEDITKWLKWWPMVNFQINYRLF